MSCAAALANIEFMEKENLPARATETGNYAMAKLRELQRESPLIGEVRGLGLMIGVELVKDAKLTPATSEAEAIRDGLLRQGVLVGVGGVYGNVIRFQPPLIITRSQIDRALAAFAAAFGSGTAGAGVTPRTIAGYRQVMVDACVRGARLFSASEITYTIRIPNSGSMGWR